MTATTPGTGNLRILLVTYTFPPMNSMGSHRPYGWARAWRDLGHDIHVLTPAKHGFDGAMDLQLDLAGIDVHEVDYLPVRRTAPVARSAGENVGALRWERIKVATRRVRFGLAMFGDLRLLAHFALVREGLRLIRSRGFDLIVATSPPEVSFFTARALSKRTGVPWVADFRDLWFRDMRLYQSSTASWLLGPVHRWLVRNAAALVTVSVGLQKRLSGYLGREVLVSYNGFFENAGQYPSRPRPWADDRIHIVYTGRVYPGRLDPEPLFRALAALRKEMDQPARTVSVDFYGNEDPWLRSLIAKYRLEDRVQLHGHVSYRESLAMQHAADALLFLNWTDAKAEGMLSGKLFEYLASRRPILALGTRKDSEAANIIADTGCGAMLTQHHEIIAWLERLLESPRPLAPQSGDIGRYSRERQARVLLEELSARLF